MLAIIAIGVRECDLLRVELVPGDIGLELCPGACFAAVRPVVIDSPAEFAHGNNAHRDIRHGWCAHFLSVVPACGRGNVERVSGC